MKNIHILLDSSKKASLDKGAETIKCIFVSQQLVCNIKEKTQTEGVWEEGAEENTWT
jgi:hypothetical protein